MGATELKTDSFQRWVMYSKEAYGSGRTFLSAEQKRAVEEGKKFSQHAYADVWAKDAALVQRVRSFLGTYFHWHQRLAKNGADLEVIQTLQCMIRGESVVLIAEQSRTGGAGGNPAPKPQQLPGFRNSLMTSHGMAYDAATAYIERYNDMVDRVNAVAARYSNAATPSLADTASDPAETATPLRDSQPFEYGADTTAGDSFEIAKTPNIGDPGWYTNPGSGQMRLFGVDRRPIVDLDFDHIHNGLQPHAHNWGPGGRDSGDDVVPFSPWNP
ncbi:hypothetical protein [Paraburkholderia sp. GAS82]|uniref:hypothetical protein n=1 Tax=Paraburkholderia sp. GAS82 TaxID=3035137 RepID=UPI003D1AE714